jgi:hypothetical protein
MQFSHLQHNFESLDANSMASDETRFISTISGILAHGPPGLKVAPCDAVIETDPSPLYMDLSGGESFGCLVIANASMNLTPEIKEDSCRISTFESSEQPLTEMAEATSSQLSVEPIRTALRQFNSSQAPRRFFRTFWRGITMRMIARNRSTTAINVDFAR